MIKPTELSLEYKGPNDLDDPRLRCSEHSFKLVQLYFFPLTTLGGLIGFQIPPLSNVILDFLKLLRLYLISFISSLL